MPELARSARRLTDINGQRRRTEDDTKETHVLCPLVKSRDLGLPGQLPLFGYDSKAKGTNNDEHATAKDPCAAYTADRSTEDEHPHIGRDGADERADFEDEDGKDDDVLGRENLGPLRVDQVEAEQCEAKGAR